MAQDLIDEYWLFRLQLDLIESRTFPAQSPTSATDPPTDRASGSIKERQC